MEKRRYLQVGEKITLHAFDEGETFKRTFTVKGIVSDGGSVICYDAAPSAGTKGILKEFYPKSTDILTRNSDNRLVLSCLFAEAKEQFILARDRYLQSHLKLLRLSRESESSSLFSFIPSFEIYYGAENANGGTEDCGSCYIWLSDPKLESFDKICAKIHRSPSLLPAKNLRLLFEIIRTLSECVKILHKNGLLHRDLKPTNFGLKTREGEVLADSLQIFDLDTICKAEDAWSDKVWSVGFSEPDVRYTAATNQSDIYSIGAVLCFALGIGDKIQNGKAYRSLQQLKETVYGAKLFRLIDCENKDALIEAVFNLLRRCLCERQQRYRCCEELTADLDYVITLIGEAKDLPPNKNPYAAICCHLYENPLYRFLDRKAQTVNLLMVGFKGYGDILLDICLQTAVMLNKKICADVLLESGEEECYLEKRPGILRYFTLKPSGSGTKSANDGKTYGEICFYAKEKTDLTQLIKEGKPCYIMVSGGDDKGNFLAAAECERLCSQLGVKSVISYIREQESEGEHLNNCTPLYINRTLEMSDSFAELRRMDLNSVLLRDDLFYANRQKAHDSLCSRRVFALSVARLVGVKHFLFTLGHNAGKMSLAAAELDKKLAQNKTSALLIQLENRRQNLLGACLDSSGTLFLYSKKELTLPDSMRQTLEFQAKSKAMEMPENMLFMVLKEELKPYPKAFSAFEEWCGFMRSFVTFNKDTFLSILYLGAKLKRELALLPQNGRHNCAELFARSESELWCELFESKTSEAFRMCLLKENDVWFLNNLPFVLSYKERSLLIVPVQIKNSDDYFANIASALLANPTRVCFVAQLSENRRKQENLLLALKYATTTLERKNAAIKSKVILIPPDSLTDVIDAGHIANDGHPGRIMFKKTVDSGKVVSEIRHRKSLITRHIKSLSI